jgi:hypothetical protein
MLWLSPCAVQFCEVAVSEIRGVSRCS